MSGSTRKEVHAKKYTCGSTRKEGYMRETKHTCTYYAMHCKDHGCI